MTPRLGYAILAVAVLAVILGVVLVVTTRHTGSHERMAHPPISRRTCMGDPFDTRAFDSTSAADVLYRFVFDATFRQDPGRAWGYATRREQNGMTRAQWATGTIPVVPEAVGVACTVGAKAYGPRKWMAVIRVNADFFLGVLLRQSGRWQVDYFMPAPTDTGAPQG